jgi:hypothetical protein
MPREVHLQFASANRGSDERPGQPRGGTHLVRDDMSTPIGHVRVRSGDWWSSGAHWPVYSTGALPASAPHVKVPAGSGTLPTRLLSTNPQLPYCPLRMRGPDAIRCALFHFITRGLSLSLWVQAVCAGVPPGGPPNGTYILTAPTTPPWQCMVGDWYFRLIDGVEGVYPDNWVLAASHYGVRRWVGPTLNERPDVGAYTPAPGVSGQASVTVGSAGADFWAD